VIKADFPASSLQSSVSHDPSEITGSDDQETFIIIISVENSSYFCGNLIDFYFSGFFDE